MTGSPPIIGVTRCSRLGDYVSSVEAAGGRVRLLDVHENPRAVLGEIQGLVLTGGADIDPVLYGERRHPATDMAEPGRDEFELVLARSAMDRDVPLLAICRGMQVLNVAAGGSLVQDIPTEVATAIGHRVESPKDAIAHAIAIAPGSRLETILSGGPDPSRDTAVNSRHHQAVRRLATSLTASATAPDGIVEAIERPGARFCVGVQWHPENFWRTGEFRPLFDAFVGAARTRPDSPTVTTSGGTK